MKNPLKFKTTLSSSALIVGASAMMLMPMPALAQIDEIITTAQRRDQSTQDVPLSVTVLSAQDLETKQINDTLDIQNFVPNVKTKVVAPWSLQSGHM